MTEVQPEFCPTCGQHTGATQRLHETRNQLQQAQDEAFDYRQGLMGIIHVLRDKQPAPRSGSVTYVAGYARAMDDMKQAVLAAVERHVARSRVATNVATPTSQPVPAGPPIRVLTTGDGDGAGRPGTPGRDF